MPRKYGRPTGQVCELDVNAIIVPEWTRDISRDYLAESVDEKGVIAPIIVGKIKGDRSGKYILIDGRGRLEIAIKRGDKYILARVVQIENEEEAILIAIELEHTKQPWDLEYTYKIIKYLEQKGYSKAKIAEILRIPRSTLYRILNIFDLDNGELKELFITGRLPLRAIDILEKARKELPEDAYENLIELILEDPEKYEEHYRVVKEADKEAEEMVREMEEEREIEEGEIAVEEVEDKYVTVRDIDIDKMRRETEEAVASIIKAHRPDIQVEILSDEDLQPKRQEPVDYDIDQEKVNMILRNVGTLKLANWAVKGPFLFVYLAEEELDLSTLIDIYQRTGCTFTILPYKIRNFKLRFYVARGNGE